MALSFRTATTFSNSSASAIVLLAPTNTAVGDLVKVIVQANGQTTIVDNNTTISVVNLTAGTDTTDDADSTTASITVTKGKLQLLTIASRADSVQPTISSITSPAGSGITWTLVGTAVNYDASGSRRTIFLYRGMATATATGTCTITWGATQTAKAWCVDELTNVDTSGTQGSGAIVQSATNIGASVTSLSVTLGAFGSVNNATYGAFSGAGDDTFTAGSGFAITGQAHPGTNEISVGCEFKATNDTSVDISLSPLDDIGGIAVELKSAAATFTEQVNDYKPNTTNGHTFSIFSRVVQDGDPPIYNFTAGLTGRCAGIAICATDTVTPEDDVAPSTTNATNRDSAGDGTAVSASINTGVNNAAHIVVAGWDTGSIGTITTPSGYTLLANANGGGEPIHASYKVIAAAGATGAQNIVNTEFGAYMTFSFSIKSVATGVNLDQWNQPLSRPRSEIIQIESY